MLRKISNFTKLRMTFVVIGTSFVIFVLWVYYLSIPEIIPPYPIPIVPQMIRNLNWTHVTPQEANKGCRASHKITHETPVVIMWTKLDDFAHGRYECGPNVPPCNFTNPDRLSNHATADVLALYHDHPVRAQDCRQCQNQITSYYSWEAWKSVRLDQFYVDWDIIMGPFSISDAQVGYLAHDLTKPPSPKTQKALASSFITNCGYGVSSNRNAIILELKWQLEKLGTTIDLFGTCFGHHNKPEPILTNDKAKNKLLLMKSYKFNLAFENSLDDAYLSEKYWQAFEVGTVPIVIGSAYAKKYAPREDAVLSMSDYPSVAAFAKELVRIAGDEDEYNKYLYWKRAPADEWQDSFWMYQNLQRIPYPCRTCVKAADLIDAQTDFPPMVDGVKFIRIRPIFDFYYKVIKAPKGIYELKRAILREYNMAAHVRIGSVYPARWRWIQDKMFNKARLECDKSVGDLPHGFQLEFIEAYH